MDITEDAALMQRSMFMKPAVYRRALSTFDPAFTLLALFDPVRSRGLRITGIPAALWFQYNDVLLIYLVRIHLIQPATSVGLIISGTTFLFAVALFRAERVGRRRILVFTHLAVIFETFASISFYCQYCSIFPDPVLGYPVDLTIHTCGELTDGTNYSTTWFAVVLLSTIILAAFYSTGLGNVPSQPWSGDVSRDRHMLGLQPAL
ncbi:hypothetical protein ARMSODRAFT_1088235 [Armillaria solidipes]|uniref:Major facilitator superfamily (MFS) profile domain-containing protein n=1 Tax=Armillaria solidipes TaxID=1076256 RepID=A0A2H3BH04_9AGAR|nr:hypothetical protein ARMSODRAFT_1088235 [Armillaria solidipes]